MESHLLFRKALDLKKTFLKVVVVVVYHESLRLLHPSRFTLQPSLPQLLEGAKVAMCFIIAVISEN